MKKRLLLSVFAILMVGLFCGLVTSAAETYDPSENYVVQTAPNEDSSISMWFEHSFDKIYTSDTTPSGMNTYSIYMAKNEIESAQFVLCSDVDHTNMNATVTQFTDGKGNTVDAEVYYQLYVTTSGVDTDAYINSATDPGFIRTGETPDPIAPLSAYARGFKLNSGKSQAFYVRAKTTLDTEPGWYSAQLSITDADGLVVKTATVYAYVWDFALSEETALQTAFYMDANSASYDYQTVYDYFLENRIVIMDPPGNLNSDNAYLTNDRVNAIRVTSGGGGQVNSYKDYYGVYPQYKDIYTDLSSMKEWEDIRDKFYFYTVDEAMSQEMHDAQEAAGVNGCETIDDAIHHYELLKQYWPDAQAVIPYHENHPYPYYVNGTAPLSSLSQAELKDGIEGMIEADCQTIWCPQARAFTPNQLLKDLGYDGNFTAVGARSLNGTVSGNILSSEHYYNWDDLFGATRDRVISSNIINKSKEGNVKDYQLWSYCAGNCGSYSYCNFLIENTGLQTKMQMWQLYQEDVTGYLYYAVSSWLEDSYIDSTTTGAYKTAFKTHRSGSEGAYTYGMGTLIYQNTMGRTKKVDYIGSLRVELLRDGIEDYQMMTMLEDLCGSEAAKAIVNSVCNNVVEYISLPNYDRSAHDASLSDSDVFALKRIELGNMVEAASATACSHTYDGGKVTTEATCLVMGVKTYTCTKCGAEDTEYIPTLHAQGDCFEVTESTPATCTEAGKTYYTCTVCGYTKYLAEKAHHENKDFLQHKQISGAVHSIYCPECEQTLDNESHLYATEYTNTCTEDGYAYEVCIYCGYSVEGEAAAAYGHAMRDGVCTACGYSENAEPEYMTGDINGDGKVNLSDIFMIKSYIAGQMNLDETQMKAADINEDGKANLADLFLVKNYVSTGIFG